MTDKSSTNKTIKLLIASDIHLSYKNIDALAQVVRDRNEKIDYVICPGDVCNFNPDNCNNDDMVRECEDEMKKIMIALEAIHPNVLYVPGNHDAKTTLLINGDTDALKLSSHSTNLHKSSIRIDDSLVILGLGGSLPSIRNGENHWVGYPYQKESELEKDLDQMVAHSQLTTNVKDDDRIILLSHSGPFNSGTTVDQVEDPKNPIYSGSKSINTYLESNKSIFLNIHGHTHHSSGMGRVGKSFIVNPGSLRTGHYVLLTLEKYDNVLWRIKSTEFNRV
ncbi:hypothetical protein CYY_003034 [Polysphondylium violaceum]|uniref:Calcineurin-like phosphoesterase domain-containing protein n=1 Tax=Polysphondylium violaceum TaxID=133409 RepID=A0A8J4UUM6_9MYCE|nr:hypothetical protein CYY_003034 [Polysphondylium violaceum]